MKTLITVADIKRLVGEKKSTVYIDAKTIITPAAQDAAKENDIKIVVDTPPVKKEPSNNHSLNEIDLCPDINSRMVSKIVEVVILQLKNNQQLGQLIKEIDEKGLVLIKGESVVLESFRTGNLNNKVKRKEILSSKDSPKMTAGIMELEDTSLERVLKCGEINYVIEGVLEIIINDRKYTGKQGDVFYTPADTRVTFYTPKQTKFFYVTCPVN